MTDQKAPAVAEFNSGPKTLGGETVPASQNDKVQLAHDLHAKAISIFSQPNTDPKEKALEALNWLKHSVAIEPTARSLLNTAKVCMVLNDQSSAVGWALQCLDWCARSVNIGSSDPSPVFTEVFEAHRLLGQAHAHLAQYAQAIPHLEAFHQSCPQDMANEFDLAYALLALGQYEKGWQHYQVRYKTGFAVSGANELTKIPAPQWQGDLTALDGKIILLLPEQGLGDEIHFARVARHLRSAGARVWIMAPPPLERLMRTLPWKERIVSNKWQSYAEIDCWSTAIRACAYIQLDPYKDKPCTPYLMADPALKRTFSSLLACSSEKISVALNWRGNPNHFNDKARSMSLSEIVQEVQVELANAQMTGKKVVLYSLQLAPTKEELSLMSAHGIVDLSGHIQDLSDMAALITLMDHIFTIDSAPAHLAGALNVKTTVLVPPRIDWRWGTLDSRPPWYPSLALKLQQRFK